MADPDILEPLLHALRDLTAWLKTKQPPGMVIGGVAVALLGRPRLTNDVDAFILADRSDAAKLLDSALEFGFAPRLKDAAAFARQTGMLLLTHAASSKDIDIALGGLPFEKECLARVQTARVEGVGVPVPSPEDLIIMKAVAHRPNDLHDVDGIVAAHPALDLARIRRWVGEFASVLESPEIVSDLERILLYHSKTGKAPATGKRPAKRTTVAKAKRPAKG